MGDAGLLGLMYAGECGGAEADALTNLVFAEALSQSTFGGFIITVLVHTDMASPHLVNAGSPSQVAKYLPRIISGELISAVAVTEPATTPETAPATSSSTSSTTSTSSPTSTSVSTTTSAP